MVNYFSMSILRGSVTTGEFILFVDASLVWDAAPYWGGKGEKNQRSKRAERGKGRCALSPFPGHRLARFFRRHFSYLTPFFAFFPQCRAWSQANDSYSKLHVSIDRYKQQKRTLKTC